MEQTVVITGSTRGLGFGLAEAFLERGHRVVINGTTQEGTAEALKKLVRFGTKVYGVAGDVRMRAAVEHLCVSAAQHVGSVDIWVNNAGIDQGGQCVADLDPRRVEAVLDVNLNGVISGTVVAFLLMKQQGSGKIFNMEGLGSDGFMMDGMTIYGTTKRAVSYFTRSFAHEIQGSGVMVGTLSPGMVVTDMLRRTVCDGSPESLKRQRFYNSMADDVEAVASFLCSRMLVASGKEFQRIQWLTKRKIFLRMLAAPFKRRNFFQDSLPDIL